MIVIRERPANVPAPPILVPLGNGPRAVSIDDSPRPNAKRPARRRPKKKETTDG